MAGNQFKEEIPENIKVELELLYKKGNFNKALDSSKKLKKKYPWSAYIYNISGVMNLALSKFDMAEEDFLRAIEISPKIASIHNNLGLTLINLKKYQEGIKTFKHAIQLKPKYMEPYNNLAIIFKKVGLLEKAIYWAKKA